MGNLKYYPNREGVFHFLKEIWPKINEELEDLEFLIIGPVDGRFKNKFKNLKGVRFLGFVNKPYSIIKNSLAFISPVRIGAGIQGKVIEVLNMNHPVISYKQGVSELDGFKNLENIIICETDDWRDWIKVLKIIFTDRGKIKWITQKGKELITKEFSAPAVSEKYFRLFKQFL